MKYVVYNNFDNSDVSILGICKTKEDAQELILAVAEETAYNIFLDDYYYDYSETMTKPGDDPMEAYLKDKIPEWEDYNKFHSNKNNISFYGWTLLMTADYYDYYNYSIGEDY